MYAWSWMKENLLTEARAVAERYACVCVCVNTV